MKQPWYEIDWPGPGRLATMAHPPGGDALPPALASLAAAGVTTLVSALADHEVAALGLAAQPRLAAAAGIRFTRLPIIDHTSPTADATPAVAALAGQLAEQIRDGGFVVCHCWAGIGRSSMLAAAALVRLGTDPSTAWRLIRQARGLAVPDSRAQERWLYEFAELSRQR